MIRILDREGLPSIGTLLAGLRDVELQRDRLAFRERLVRLGFLLAHELGRSLRIRQTEVVTPLGRALVPRLADPLVLGTVLRAGVPLWEGALQAFPEADVLWIGAARREAGPEGIDPKTQRLPIDVQYAALTPLSGRTLVYVDTMIATGSTLMELHPRIIAAAGAPSRTFVLGAIAYEPTLALLEASLSADVLVASADPTLDERGYIVPGLGDAGDLAYGTPLRVPV